jgi:hypothetical protein
VMLDGSRSSAAAGESREDVDRAMRWTHEGPIGVLQRPDSACQTTIVFRIVGSEQGCGLVFRWINNIRSFGAFHDSNNIKDHRTLGGLLCAP